MLPFASFQGPCCPLTKRSVASHEMAQLSVLEEESNMYEVFPSHVDTTCVPVLPDSPVRKNAKPQKTSAEVVSLLQAGKKREVMSKELQSRAV